MSKPITPVVGYLVPEFPGQTHAFFWREIAELERRGVEVQLISTRRPPARLVSHDWAPEAMARTTYLLPVGVRTLARSVAALPVHLLVDVLAGRAARAERRAVFADLLLATPLAVRLRQIAGDRGISHIHVHSCARSAYVAMLSHRMGGPAYSLTLHGPLSDYGPGQDLKWGDAAFATVVTQRLRDEVGAELSEIELPPVRVQAMGVDPERFRRESPYTPAIPGKALHLFSCGRLNYMKGHQYLVSAVAALTAQGVDVRLEIAGEDERGGLGFRQTLHRQIVDLGLEDRVTLLGAISENAILDQLRRAHVFVLASLNEALGVAYMEAMSCCVPVIGTWVGGVTELVESGRNGILVPPKQPQAISAALETLIQDPDLACKLGVAGRETIVARFGAGIGAQSLIEAIRATGKSAVRRDH